MKSILLPAIIFLTSYLPVEAQKKGVTVTYQLKSYGGHESEQVLKFLDGKSHFAYRKQNEELHNDQGMTFYHRFAHHDIYTDLAVGKMVYTRIVMLVDNKKTTLISSWPLQKFDWKILSETKELLGYKVQKATTKAYYYEYEGEDSQYSKGEVTAWYAPDLPFSGGPEGYYGLPGVILELEYSRIFDHYVAKSIDTNSTHGPLVIPTEGFPISKEQMIFPKDNPIDRKQLRDYQRRQGSIKSDGTRP